MTDTEPGEGFVALDYTPIVRHRGKQFTAGDLSLSGVGGIDLHAAGLALAIGAAAGLVSTVGCLLLGKPLFLGVLPGLLVWTGFYLWFAREVVDSEPPLKRILLAFSSRRTQPTAIGGTAAEHRGGAIRRQLGGRSAVEYRQPTTLHWTVILKRPTEPARIKVGQPLAGRAVYSPEPQPRPNELLDDHTQFHDWFTYIASAGNPADATEKETPTA